MRNKQWTVSMILIVVSIFFVALNTRPAVTAIGPLFNVLMESLQVSNTHISLLTSIPVFCMGLFAPLAVPLQKRLGTKGSIELLLIIIAIANGLRFVEESYSLLVVTSFAAGFAIAIIGPILNAYIKDKFPSRFTTVVGVYSFGIGAGATLSAGLTVSIYNAFDKSWTIALGGWVVLAIMALVIWLLWVPKEQVGKKEATITKHDKVRNPWKNGHAWMMLIFFGLQTALFFALMSWLPAMLQDKGFTLVVASAVLTFMSIVQLVGNITITMLMEKWSNRIAWLLSLSALGIVGFVLLWIGTGYMVWFAVFIIGIVLSGLFPIGLLLPLDEATNNMEANSWSSMVLSGGFMISAILPLLIGVLYDKTANHNITYAIFIIFMIGIIGITLLLRKNKNVKHATK
ncbi:transporter [Lysinibacillus contaminans]|uniref:Transporter n=1 Tax=Lysinibacillus contaminans TaxID=1293441 RepID=A0ABR5K0L8_9BACI|nr:MFS transporter [Lysinibacillus contaminans]KOS68465.1 transporter [Lysinibacillus contaminans]